MKIILSGILLALFSVQLQASMIEYIVSSISGDRWQYDYTVTNTGPDPITDFTVFFDADLYSQLELPAPSTTPADWIGLADVQPNNFLDNPGQYDAFTVTPGAEIAAGESLGLFSVQFDWLGAGLPGSQPFNIIDPNDFSTLESGQTVFGPVVPLPAAIWMFGSGIFGLLVITRRKVKSSQ